MSVGESFYSSHSHLFASANETVRNRGPDEETARKVYEAIDDAHARLVARPEVTFFSEGREIVLEEKTEILVDYI
jgi:hypothetical protein